MILFREGFSVSVVCAFLVLTACGKNDTSDTPPNNGTGLSVEQSSVSFAAAQGELPPPAQTVELKISATDVEDVVATHPPSMTPPPWLNTAVRFGSGPAQLLLSILDTNLSVGTHETTVRVVARRRDQSVVAFRDVRVRYDVLYQLAASPAALQFQHVYGVADQPAAQPVAISGTGTPWTATASEPWLTVSPTQGTGPGNASVSVNAGSLPVGTHRAQIDFTVPNHHNLRRVEVVLVVRPPTLVLNPPGYTIVFAQGSTSTQDLRATLFPYPHTEVGWKALSLVTWLTATPEFGGFSASNLFSQQIVIRVDPSKAPSTLGTHMGQIVFNPDYSGPVPSVPLQPAILEVTLEIQ